MTPTLKFHIPYSKFAALAALAVLVVGSLLSPLPVRAVGTVNITFDPAQPQTGGSTTMVGTVSGATVPANDAYLATVKVCKTPPCTSSSQFVTVKQVNGTGPSVTTSLDITNDYDVGANTVTIEMAYGLQFETPLIYNGTTSLIVRRADSTTGPRVNVSESGRRFDANKVKIKFDITYLPGNSTRTPTTYTANCGGGDPKFDNLANRKFECWYNPPAAVYNVTAAAFDATGPIASGPPAPGLRVSITGNERTELSVGGGGSGWDLASPLINLVNILLGGILGVLRWIMWLIGWLIAVPLLEESLKLEAGNVAGGVILTGWIFVRDIVNMMFILVLIVIGFGTMLRIESYSYKKLLANLIMMALLVNFSLVIGRIVIQIADAAQFSFLSVDAGVNSVKTMFQLLNTTHITSIFDGFRNVMNFDSATAGATTAALLFQFLFELAAFLTFVALAAFMLIRTVALWILLILSPVAYALFILPATASYAKKWWDTFIKYVLFGPLIAFFLRLTVELYKNGLQIKPESQLIVNFDRGDLISQLKTLSEGRGFTFGQALELVLIYVLVLGFLWAGMIAAKQMGIFGANAIVGLAEKGMKAPFKYGGKGIKAGTKALGGLALQAYSGWVGSKIGERSKRGELAAREAKLAERRLKAAKTPQEAKKYQDQLNAAREKQRTAAKGSAGFRAMSFLDPKVLKEAWKKRREEKELRAYGPAVGHMQDTFNRMMPSEWLKPSRLKKGEFGKKTYHGMIGERAVVSKESEELLKGVRTREDAAQILQNAFQSGDKDEIMAALKVEQHGNNQDDYMNLEGKKFSPIRYLNEITGKMKAAKFSDEEITTILDDLKETAEQQGRVRAYGYTTGDPDGTVRAANDLSYYKNLKGPELAEGLQDIGEKFKLTAEETGDKDFAAVADMFLRAGQRAGSGESFEKIAASEKWGGNDNQTLEFAMTERRFMNEAGTKLRRGNAGTHARGMEAALFVDQDPEKGWDDEQNLMGKMLVHELPPNIASSATGRIHESQGRLVEGFGGFRDDFNGKWSLPDFDIAYKSDVQIQAESAGDARKGKFLEGQRDKHRINLEKIIATRKLDPKWFNTIATSNRLFTATQRNKFAEQFNKIIKASTTHLDPQAQKLINETSRVASTHGWTPLKVDQKDEQG